MSDTAKPTYRVTEASIADLRAQPEGVNTRRHNPRNIGMIADSMQEVGAARSVVIDETNDLMAGSGSVEAFAQAGMEKVLIVETDGETLVAVKRTGLTPKQKLRLALADNRTNETSEWDRDVFAELIANEDGDNPFKGLWNENELSALLLEDTEKLDPDKLWKEMPEFVQFDAFGVKRLVVHFQTQKDYEDFARLINQALTPKTRFIWYPPLPDADLKSMKVVDDGKP